MRFFRLSAVSAVLLAGLWQLHAAAKSSLPPKYSRWLNEEVVYIISDEERKAFLQLNTDQARDAFIEEFWDIRNPLRGSEQNPYKEEHYRRLQYANEHFGRMSNTPGWKTDMGRTWILFGKPESRAPYKGYGQLYPLELWFYSNKNAGPSLPSFFYVLFFMPEDIGEYRFYHPVMDGPMKLVRGSQFRTNRDVYNFLKPLAGDLAHAAFSLIPGEPIDTVEFNPSMTGDMLVNKIQEFANDSFQLKRLREMRYLRARVKSWFLVTQQQPLELAAIVLADPGGHYWLDYALLAANESLGHRDASGANLMVSAGFRLLTEKGDLVVEDAEERAYPAFEKGAGEAKFKPFLLANRVALVPGSYKLEVQVTNREAGRSYKAERAFVVGAPGQAALAGPLLAASVNAVARPDPNTPFQYFGVQFVPDVQRRFSARDKIRTLVQVRLPDLSSADYRLEYVIANVQDREMRRTQADALSPGEFRNGALLKSKTIALEGLEPGEYRAVFNLKRGGSPAVLASAMAPFRIADQVAAPALYFLSNFQAAAGNGVAAYVRALESISQNRQEEAAGYLREALDRMPSNTFALRTLIGIYFNIRKYNEVTALYSKMGLAALNTAPETLAQVALSFWETGNAETARRVLEVGKAHFPQSTLVAAALKKVQQPR